MINWEFVKDWTPIVISVIVFITSVIFSTFALIISLITLYIAHLRGPNIQVADSGGWVVPSYSSFGPDKNEGSIDINLLFVNSGNRSGILYDINITFANIIYQIVYKTPLKRILPIVISPGQGEQFKPTLMTAKPPEKTWVDTLKDQEYLEIELTFKTSTSFPWNKIKKKFLKIDIQGLKKIVAQRKL